MGTVTPSKVINILYFENIQERCSKERSESIVLFVSVISSFSFLLTIVSKTFYNDREKKNIEYSEASLFFLHTCFVSFWTL